MKKERYRFVITVYLLSWALSVFISSTVCPTYYLYRYIIFIKSPSLYYSKYWLLYLSPLHQLPSTSASDLVPSRTCLLSAVNNPVELSRVGYPHPLPPSPLIHPRPISLFPFFPFFLFPLTHKVVFFLSFPLPLLASLTIIHIHKSIPTALCVTLRNRPSGWAHTYTVHTHIRTHITYVR